MFKKDERKCKTKLTAETIPKNQAAKILSQASEDLTKSNADQVFLKLEIKELSAAPPKPSS